ncbi:unnamed protein product, partial [Anisakis simplex]|uniref:Hemicentin-1 (inferred by orthology to a human protein) n=1 Tax=Anisakis simplex TaxID=6269 RepID=A0A0M3J7F9_ANISI
MEEEFAMYDEEQRRIVSKQPLHSSRLSTPPPAKKQQLHTTHERIQLSREKYDFEEARRAKSSAAVGHPPHFTRTLVSAVTATGDSAKFEGDVTGWPAPEVQWTKDGVPVSTATNPELDFSNVAGHVSLSFPNAQSEHA